MQNFDIIDLAGLRFDGRKSEELRKLRHRIGVIDYADGSAYIEQGLNKILAVIHGPREPKRKDSAGDQVRFCINRLTAFIAIVDCINLTDRFFVFVFVFAVVFGFLFFCFECSAILL